jgi:hypothetical protein
VSLGSLAGPNVSLGEAASTAGTLGGTAMTSLAAIAAVLGGFYEADNDPSDAEEAPKASGKTESSSKSRIAEQGSSDEIDDEGDADAEKKRSKR